MPYEDFKSVVQRELGKPRQMQAHLLKNASELYLTADREGIIMLKMSLKGMIFKAFCINIKSLGPARPLEHAFLELLVRLVGERCSSPSCYSYCE